MGIAADGSSAGQPSLESQLTSVLHSSPLSLFLNTVEGVGVGGLRFRGKKEAGSKEKKRRLLASGGRPTSIHVPEIL